MLSYTLRIEVSTKSTVKLWKLLPLKSFVLNEEFEIAFRFTNVGENRFPGGYVVMKINWFGGAPEFVSISLPKLERSSSMTTQPTRLRTHAIGMGIVSWIEQRASDGSDILLMDREQHKIPQGEAIDGIPTTTWQDLSASGGLMVAAISLFLLVLHDYLFAPSSTGQFCVGVALLIFFILALVYLVGSRLRYARKKHWPDEKQ
jgi:hypothetical protein